MRAAILTLTLLLTASGCPQEPTKQPTTSCHEEDPCWNCHTMGNRRCSPPKDRKSIPPKPRRTVGQA